MGLLRQEERIGMRSGIYETETSYAVFLRSKFWFLVCLWRGVHWSVVQLHFIKLATDSSIVFLSRQLGLLHISHFIC